MSVVVVPELVAVLAKLEKDVLAELQVALLPALAAEIEALSPAAAQAVEGMVFSAVMPAAQAALASLIAKIPAA